MLDTSMGRNHTENVGNVMFKMIPVVAYRYRALEIIIIIIIIIII